LAVLEGRVLVSATDRVGSMAALDSDCGLGEEAGHAHEVVDAGSPKVAYVNVSNANLFFATTFGRVGCAGTAVSHALAPI
jgi:hypothetical protein